MKCVKCGAQSQVLLEDSDGYVTPVCEQCYYNPTFKKSKTNERTKTMAKYIKIAPVEAEQFVTWGKAITSVTMHGVTYPVYEDERGRCIIIPSKEGNHRCNELDWVLKGIEGEFWAIDQHIFEKTYRKVEST